MVIIVFNSYPRVVGPQMAERYSTSPDLPDYMKQVGVYTYNSEEKGACTLGIYEFEEPRMAEAVLYMAGRCARYDDIPGLNYDFKIAASAEDAQRIADMMPAT